MHNRDKHPETWDAFEKAKDRKDELMAKRKVYLDAIAFLRADIERMTAPLISEIESLHSKANANRDEMVSVSKEISSLAKAMGAKGIVAEMK